MLRYRADLKTLAYLGLMVTFFIVLWLYGIHADGTFNVVLCALLLPLLCFFTVADAVISHNHNHSAIFRNRWANLLAGCVISFFYGFPSFGWIPTHNQNHHVFNNRPGDHSITTRPCRRVGLLGALFYPTVTSLTQARLIRPFLSRCWHRNRFLFWRAIVEYVFFVGIMTALFIIDWQKTLLFAVLPQQVALFFIQHFNYLQHFETDSFSEYGHSRNFTGRILNYCLFNNGYHTVHHLKPGLHWSLTPQFHAEVAHKIPQRLCVTNLGKFWFNRFIAGVLLRQAPSHMTLPAELSPDTLLATERGTAALEHAYRLRGFPLPPRPAKMTSDLSST